MKQYYYLMITVYQLLWIQLTLEFYAMAETGATVIFHGIGLINIGFVGIKLIMFLIR